MQSLPEKLLLRRGEVRNFLGVSKQEMAKLVENKVLPSFHLRGGARAFFRRCDVEKLINKEIMQ